MKTITAAFLLVFSIAANAADSKGEQMQMNVHCWSTNDIARLVESKRYSVSRYYEASFLNAKGHMAELISNQDREMLIFAFVGDRACLVSVVKPTADDMKRAGL